MERKRKGALDANVLLRLILNDNPHQAVSAQALIDSGGIYDVADVVLFEIVFVLEKIYRMPRGLVADNMRALIRNPHLSTNTKLFEHTLPLYEKHKKLSIVDCALVSYAKLNNTSPVYTFDKALAKTFPQDAVLVPYL